jgi:hypothetical protein
MLAPDCDSINLDFSLEKKGTDMTKTFQEITEAIEETNLDPITKNAFGFLVESFAIADEIYDTEADAVEAMVDQLYQDKASITDIIRVVTGQQTWIVIVRLDGAETIVLSREVRAASKEEAETEFLTGLQAASPDGGFKLEYTYGPF